MDDLAPATNPSRDHLLGKIMIEVSVVVGKAKPLIRDLLALEENAVLPLDRKLDDPVELFAGDKLIARGVLEKCEGSTDGQLAIRLTEVVQTDAIN